MVIIPHTPRSNAPRKRACAPRKRACAPRKRACHCEPPSSRSGIGAIVWVRRRVFCPPFCTSFKIGGKLGVGCVVGVLLIVTVLQNAGTRPPASSLTLVAAPQVWWASWRGFERRGSRGHPHEAHCRSRSAPTQNTNVQKATRPPHSGGQRRRRGGLVPAFCKTCNKKPPVLGGSAEGAGGLSRALHDLQEEQNTNRAPNARSAPLLRRSRNTGGPRTNDSEGRGGRTKTSHTKKNKGPRQVFKPAAALCVLLVQRSEEQQRQYQQRHASHERDPDAEAVIA